MTFSELVHARRSVRRFDEKYNFDHEAVTRALELTVLSPNSSNMQTWEFYRIKSANKLEAMTKACMGQGAARTASEMVVFVCRPDLWEKRASWNLKQIMKNVKDPANMSKLEKRGQYYYQTVMPLFYGSWPFGLKTLFRKGIALWYTLTGKPIMRWSTKDDIRVVCHKSLGIAAQTFMLSMKNEGYDTCPMEGFDEQWAAKIIDLPKGAEICMIIGCGKGLPEGILSERVRLPMEEVVFEL